MELAAPSCNPCTVGQKVTVSVRLSYKAGILKGPSPISGFVNFTFNSSTTAFAISVPISPTSAAAGSGFTVIGTATASAQLLGVGDNLIAASLVNNQGYIGATAVRHVTVNLIPTSVSVFATPNPVLNSSTVKLTAGLGMDSKLAAGLGAAPTGTITYMVTGRPPLTAALDTPIAFTTPASTALTKLSITAMYSGDANYAPSTSNPNTLTVMQTLLPPVAFHGAAFDILGNGSSEWLITPESGQNPGFAVGFGQAVWIPITGDWTGSGTSFVGAFDPVTDIWHIGGSAAGASAEVSTFPFGRTDCSNDTRFSQRMPASGSHVKPVAGDWSGIGHAGVGVYDPDSGIWCLRNTASPGPPDAQFQFKGDTAVVGDWDGNGTTTVGLFFPTCESLVFEE